MRIAASTVLFPLLATFAVFMFAYWTDGKDGSVQWVRLMLGTVIAAVGFVVGSFIVSA